MRTLASSVSLTLLACLCVASSASGQPLCVAQVPRCIGPGDFTRICFSADPAIGVAPGANCAPPLANRVAREVCADALGLNLCCGCVLPGVLACNAALVNSNTVQIVIQSDLGLQSVEPIIAENVSLSGLPIMVGTTNPVQVLATKVDPSIRSRIELRACDPVQCLLCDPVLTLTTRDTGKPVREVIADLPEAESKVTVRNGTPGLRNLLIEVNGESFKINGLKDGAELTIDVASAMLPGEVNFISLTGRGNPGGQAAVMIHD